MAPAAWRSVEHRRPQGRALGRIRARADLVQQHQGPRTGVGQDADDVLHMPGKGGERLLDALPIADIHQNLIEKAHDRAALGRNVQPALGHEREKADRLEDHGLSARIRSGDQEHPVAAPDRKIERHRFPPEQRVASPADDDTPSVAQCGGNAAQRPG